MKQGGNYIRNTRVGRESFEEVFDVDDPLQLTPHVTTTDVARWLGIDVVVVNEQIAVSENLQMLAAMHPSGIVGLSPIGILVLTYEMSDFVDPGFRVRAADMLQDWLVVRAVASDRLRRYR